MNKNSIFHLPANKAKIKPSKKELIDVDYWVESLLVHAKRELDDQLKLQDEESLKVFSKNDFKSLVDDALAALECNDFRTPCFVQYNTNIKNPAFSMRSMALSEEQAKNLEENIKRLLCDYLNEKVESIVSAGPLVSQQHQVDDDYTHMAGVLGSFDGLELCDNSNRGSF